VITLASWYRSLDGGALGDWGVGAEVGVAHLHQPPVDSPGLHDGVPRRATAVLGGIFRLSRFDGGVPPPLPPPKCVGAVGGEIIVGSFWRQKTV